jgi:hypothetical protein
MDAPLVKPAMSQLVTLALVLLDLAIIIIVLIGLLLWRRLPHRKVTLPKLVPIDPLMSELAEPLQTVFDPRPNQYEVMLKRLRGWGSAIAVINILGAVTDMMALQMGVGGYQCGSVVVADRRRDVFLDQGRRHVFGVCGPAAGSM